MKRCNTFPVALAAVIALSGCASTRVASPDRFRANVAAADAAYRQLTPGHVTGYNTALNAITRAVDLTDPGTLRNELGQLGVRLDEPAVQLPLVGYHSVRPASPPNESSGIGAPVLLEYDTSHVSVYPREGMFLPATAIYRRVRKEPHLSFITDERSVTLRDASYPLASAKRAAAATLVRRSHRVAQSGLTNFLHPDVRAKAEVVLTAPYDPKKIPILLLHGLQSTPFTFLKLATALEANPQIARRYQFWSFYYSTGTPVMLSALRLREQLERTVQTLDPNDADFATHHIIVIGHSMGGLLAHTLVSSSGDRLWKSVFVVPPEELRGNPETVRLLQRALIFKRDKRVVRAIFIATPHRGSEMADSWIGRLGESLVHVPRNLQTGFSTLMAENPDDGTREAAAFFTRRKFTSIGTLSPHEPLLLALACLPIAVPFHSIIGEKHPGGATDGVVRYASAHLDGASSELVVHSGHDAFNNPDAQNELARILRQESPLKSARTQTRTSMPAGHAEERNVVFQSKVNAAE